MSSPRSSVRRLRSRRLVATSSAVALLLGGGLATVTGPATAQAPLATATASVPGANLSVAGTTVEYLDEPLGLDTRHPRFSWTLEADRRDAAQAAYQVQVATSADALAAGEGLLWDTGRVDEGDSVNVEYAGEPLTSATTYSWRVRVWSDGAGPSAWSETSTFETGLLEADDWVAQWVAPAQNRAGGSYLRSEVTLPDDIQQARLYVSGRGNFERGPDGQGICCEQQFGLARGIYEAYVNGERVSDTEIESTMVDTRVRAMYRTYDVTDLVTAGDNALGAMIGEDSDVLAQLRVTTTDGEVLDVGTDGSWTSAPGPVTRAHRYHGETYDARREIAGWSTTDADESAAWQPVRVSSTSPGRMEAAVHEPMRVVETHKPVAVTNPAPGVHVLDFGTNMSGWTRLSLDLPAGTTVTLKHGERLSNGRVDNGIIGAQQTNRYTAAGGPVTWEPSFVYAGFRWVEVTGLPEAPAPGSIVAREVHNDVAPTGTFTSSVDLLNRLHTANVQTQVNGLHAVPEDTPTREKRGWMADAHIAAEATINNFGMDAFYASWVEEMRSAQQPDGRVPDIVPTEPGGAWETRSDPAWAVAHVLIPAYVHERYADTRVLAEHYASIRDYLAYLDTTTSGDLLTSPVNTWGNDWLGIEGTDSTLFRSGFYLWALREGAKAARLLDKPADAQQMDARADQVAAAINERYLDPVEESYGPSQFANAFPLVLDIVPERHVDGVVDTLVRDVVEERGGHFTGGLPGIKYIPEALALHGRSDVVLDVVTTTSYPGWGYMLENGPGTIWEDWGGVSSLNHPMFTSIDNWLYESVAGIDQAP
ncbi:MAG TPA: family 78 glycoside hydrolase catalytic domain, partial [Nocardioides sp.]|nr:family 78 glycoside hydrolase catalytic domain [Nocardioides sp.]